MSAPEHLNPRQFPQTKGGSAGSLPSGLQFKYEPGGVTETHTQWGVSRSIRSHVISASVPHPEWQRPGDPPGRTMKIGQLALDGRSDPDGGRRVADVDVSPDYERRGVASSMWEHAHTLGLNPRHEDMGVITGAGASWASRTPEHWRTP